MALHNKLKLIYTMEAIAVPCSSMVDLAIVYLVEWKSKNGKEITSRVQVHFRTLTKGVQIALPEMSLNLQNLYC